MRALTRWGMSLMLSFAATLAHAAQPAQTAATLLDRLQAGDVGAAEEMLTPEMSKAVPAAQLQALWNSFGGLQERGAAQVSARGDISLVTQRLRFAVGDIDTQVAVDASGRVAGLNFKPAAAQAPPAPSVPSDASFKEMPFNVVSGKGNLPGTLALPKGKGPFRAVVLVHGSGPQDRDETIGPNRPFLDVARGLAAHGIAVLRYEKRTKARPEEFNRDNYTVDDETTDDAVAAVASLVQTTGIDPQHVYVMGHSQGGMLAPRIAQRSGKVAGLVMWSAPARSLLTVLPEQNRYLLGLDGSISADDQAFLDKLDAQIAAARGTEPVAAKDLPLGVPATYWRAFEKIDPVADAKASALPILLLQGGRDFQVVDTDWQLWKRSLAGQRRASFERYPALNHLGVPGEGPSSLQEYNTPGEVLPQLVDDVARWIEAQR
ncbi:alpha/beta hydrolase [Stenotrophomonas rhizophila]|uniref:alpha/beta hydrolase n=1 Tax=Stenotrophomonas rhizophila TaxID=216778 RepID=UPI0028ABDC19|nr:alpha/beta fold hydrolase [Stenotrophomonas rhizophila]